MRSEREASIHSTGGKEAYHTNALLPTIRVFICIWFRISVCLSENMPKIVMRVKEIELISLWVFLYEIPTFMSKFCEIVNIISELVFIHCEIEPHIQNHFNKIFEMHSHGLHNARVVWSSFYVRKHNVGVNIEIISIPRYGIKMDLHCSICCKGCGQAPLKHQVVQFKSWPIHVNDEHVVFSCLNWFYLASEMQIKFIPGKIVSSMKFHSKVLLRVFQNTEHI